MATGVLVGGHRVKLESIRIGGTLYTSKEAIARFIAALNAPVGELAASVVDSDAERDNEKLALQLR